MAKKTETLTIKVNADTKQADKALSALDKDLDALGGGSRKKTIKVDADTKAAERSIDDLLRDVDKLSSEDATIRLKLEQQNLQSQLDDIYADVQKLDASDPTIDIKMAQVTAVLGDLDKVNTKLVELEDKAGKAGQGNRDLSDSARGANSALANMVGNSVQDLGALGGVVGSLGVGIGQMGEYAADAALGGEALGASLKSMALVAGPIAALSAGLFLVSKAFGTIQENKALDAERAQAYAAAIEDAGIGAEAVVERLREADGIMAKQQGDVFGFEQWLFGKDPIDIVDNLDQINVTATELGETFEDLRRSGEVVDFDSFLDSAAIQQISLDLEKAGVSGQANSVIIHSLFDEYQAWNTESEHAAANTRFFASTVDSLNKSLGKMKLDDDPFSEFQTTWNAVIKDIADGEVNFQGTAVQVDFLAKSLGITTDEVLRLGQAHLDEQMQDVAEGIKAAADAAAEFREEVADAAAIVNTSDFRASAISTVFDTLNEMSRLDTSTQLTDIADAWTAVDDAARNYPQSIVPFDLIPDNWDEVQNMPEDLQGITAAIGGFRDAVQVQLAEAFEFGGPDALRQAAQDITTQFEGPFREMMARNGASVEETNVAWNQFLRDVGLAPENIEMTVTLAIDQQKLQVLQDIASGAGLEGDRKLNFDIAISNQDPTTALAILNEQLAGTGQEVTITYDADTNQVETALVPLQQPFPVNVTTQTDTGEVTSAVAAVGTPIIPVATGTPDTSTTDAALATYSVSGIAVPVTTAPDETFTTTATQIDEFGNPVEIVVLAPKSPSLGAMDKLIDHVARKREVGLNVKADNAGAVDRILDAIAEERDANFFAQPTNTGPADVALDKLAMPSEDGRLAHIFAQPDNIVAADTALDGVAAPRPSIINITAPNANAVNAALDYAARNRISVIYVETVTTDASKLTGSQNAQINQPETRSAETTAFGVDPLTAVDETTVPSSTVASSSSFAFPVSQPSVTNNLHVTVQAAVIGNRFDVQRAVARAVRGDRRLNGTREP